MITDQLTYRLRNDLEVAARTLRRYEELHRSKGTPDGLEKAEANAVLARCFENTVLAFDGAQVGIAPPPTYTEADMARAIDSINNSAAGFGLELGFELVSGRSRMVLRRIQPLTVLEAMLRANPLATPAIRRALPPGFLNVACSQCGGTFGPGEHGFSRCQDHQDRKGSV